MIEIDRAAFDVSMARLLGDIELGARKAARDGVDAAVESAQRTTYFQDRTGATRGSIRAEYGDFSGKLISGKATRFLENGTKPHTITARGNGVLKFQINGQWISKKSVQHPGTMPRPFMLEAGRLGERAMEFSLDTNTNDAIARSNT